MQLDPLHIIILGIVQGLTEFLPVSSSGHLILLPVLLGWPDQGLAHDVAAHLGTLAAVALYFRRDVRRMLLSLGHAGHGPLKAERRLLFNLCLATLPVIGAGLLLHDLVATTFRDPLVIAVTTPGYGLLLLWADRGGRQHRDDVPVGWRDALCIGLAQCLAIVPGTSRSGITMTAALFLGLGRTAAARFSFLLSIPAILLAGVYEFGQLLRLPEPAPWGTMGLVGLISAVSGWITIHYFLKFISRVGMLPFALYRFALGGVLIAVFV